MNGSSRSTRRSSWLRAATSALAGIALAVGACSPWSGSITDDATAWPPARTPTFTPGTTAGSTSDGPVTGQVLVSAASSLAASFGDIEAAFEAAHPGVDVVVNVAGSSSLREQVLAGAPVDVFAAANTATMDQVVAAGAARDPLALTTNSLQIAVPRGNPAGITGLEDFAEESLFVGLCATGVPCGDFAREVLTAAGVTPRLDTSEPDVQALVTKVAAGELDAGITYVTDVAASDGSVEGVDVPEQFNVVAEYWIVVLAQAPNPAAATAFVDFVTSAAGHAVFASHGFGGP